MIRPAAKSPDGIRSAMGCLAAALLILLLRTWILFGHSLAIGAAGDPRVLLANKLRGWLHHGALDGHWSWSVWSAGVLWEWLPAVLFGAGAWRLFRLRPPGGERRFRLPDGPWLPAGLLFLIASVISLGVFEAIPHVQDSIAQQFQAKVFATGRAWAPVPPEGWLLRSEFMLQHEGRWFSQYPPGHAAVLALGELAGAPWLVCPALGALSAVLLHGTAFQLYGRRTATLAAWLFCLSPFVWFMSGERMNHTSNLVWVLAALRLAAPLLRRHPTSPGPVALFAAGLAVGIAATSRPLCGASWAVVLAGLLLPFGTATPAWGPATVRNLMLYVLGAGAGAAPMLAFNAVTTGSPWLTGYELQWGSSGWGFGKAQWGPPHTVGDGLSAAAANWDALGKYLFEWPVPGTLLLAGCALLPRWRRADRFLLAALVGLTAAYVPYFFQDLCLGPRFLYAALPAVILLSARGAVAGAARLGSRSTCGPRAAIRALPAWIAVLVAAGVVTNGPVLWRWFAADYWGTGTDLVREVERQGLRNAIVFIRDRGRLRCEELRRRGIPLSLAQSAVNSLEPELLDRWMADADRSPASFSRLSGRLIRAVVDPTRRHYRRTPPWIEATGISSNVNMGFWANGPSPASQSVLYALHPGDRLPDVLPAFPGRSAWEYDWDPAGKRFRLREWRDPTKSATRGR